MTGQAVALIVTLTVALPAIAQTPPDPPIPTGRPEPESVLRERGVEYSGPGREDPLPEGLTEVGICWFGPDDPANPLGGDLWVAASLAIEEANERGGYHGLPYRLIPAWSDDPWGTGVARLARALYEEQVWAIVGGMDGATTHLAEQVAAKARVTVVNPVGTDVGIHLANVSWVFSMPPDDAAIAEVVAAAAGEGDGTVLVSSTDHDSRALVTAVFAALARSGVTPRLHLNMVPGQTDVSTLVEAANMPSVRNIVIITGPLDAARLVRGLRASGYERRVMGGPGLARRAFVDAAGIAAEGVLVPLLVNPDAVAGIEFAEAFRARAGRGPDAAATNTYDAVRIVIRGIGAAGPNRALVREAIAAGGPWDGAGGRVEWDSLGRNVRLARLATIRDGVVVEWDRELAREN